MHYGCAAGLGPWRVEGSGLKDGSLKACERCGSSLLPSWLVWRGVRHRAEGATGSRGGGPRRLCLKVEELLSRRWRRSRAS